MDDNCNLNSNHSIGQKNQGAIFPHIVQPNLQVNKLEMLPCWSILEQLSRGMGALELLTLTSSRGRANEGKANALRGVIVIHLAFFLNN